MLPFALELNLQKDTDDGFFKPKTILGSQILEIREKQVDDANPEFIDSNRQIREQGKPPQDNLIIRAASKLNPRFQDKALETDSDEEEVTARSTWRRFRSLATDKLTSAWRAICKRKAKNFHKSVSLKFRIKNAKYSIQKNSKSMPDSHFKGLMRREKMLQSETNPCVLVYKRLSYRWCPRRFKRT